ncbi:MAG: peptidylprolyl isomerase [Pseudomonadales bacterium]|nr:peptidylprolyl isomerase [Pseudomonadales bacterium]
MNKIFKTQQILGIVLLLGAALQVSVAQAQVQWLDRSIAIVEDSVILQSQFDARLINIEKKLDFRPEGAPKPSRAVIEQQVLDVLILESIQLQMAQRRGIRIDDDELNTAVQGIAGQNKMTLQEFKVAVQEDGLSYLDAREQIRSEMLLNRVQQWTLRNRIAVSAQEIDSYLNSAEGQQRLSTEYLLSHVLLTVPTGTSVQTLAKIEKEANAIAAEFKQGLSFLELSRSGARGEYTLRAADLGWRKIVGIPSLFAKQVPAMVKGDIVGPIQSPSGFHFIRLEEKRGAAVHIVDEVLIRHILVSPNEVRTDEYTKQLAMSLSERIKKGEDFAVLAKQFSEDPGSAQEGGALGWAGYDKYVPAFSATAKRLEVGEMSEPFQTQFGWHILNLLERRNEDRSVEFQRNQIRHLIFNRKFEEEKLNWLRKIREESFVEILTPEA